MTADKNTGENLPKSRLALLLREELAREQKLARPDVPANMAQVASLLDVVRDHGMARVVNTLLPGVGGFCAPVFDADGHMVLGMVALGSLATFDPEWGGLVAAPLKASADQLSSDLGYLAV